MEPTESVGGAKPETRMWANGVSNRTCKRHLPIVFLAAHQTSKHTWICVIAQPFQEKRKDLVHFADVEFRLMK